MKYRKKLEVVEALQWTGNNLEEILSFAEGSLERYLDLEMAQKGHCAFKKEKMLKEVGRACGVCVM